MAILLCFLIIIICIPAAVMCGIGDLIVLFRADSFFSGVIIAGFAALAWCALRWKKIN
jgi:hypothetical protein